METLDTLIANLNSDDSAAAEEAQHALYAFGLKAVTPVLKVVPALNVFGQLCVLELLESLPAEDLKPVTAPSVEDVVGPLLRSHNEVVREWAANVLRHVDARGSIMLLRQAVARANSASIPLDWTERVALRAALRALGDRTEVIPPLLVETVINHPKLVRCWPAMRIKELIVALAKASQVLLYLQAWRLGVEGDHWVESPRWEVDLNAYWSDAVERSRLSALTAVEGWLVGPDVVVTLEWIAESDRG